MNFPIYLKFCNYKDHSFVLGYKRVGLISYIVYFKDGRKMVFEYEESVFKMTKHLEDKTTEIITREEAALLFGEV